MASLISQSTIAAAAGMNSSPPSSEHSISLLLTHMEQLLAQGSDAALTVGAQIIEMLAAHSPSGAKLATIASIYTRFGQFDDALMTLEALKDSGSCPRSTIARQWFTTGLACQESHPQHALKVSLCNVRVPQAILCAAVSLAIRLPQVAVQAHA